MDSLKVYNEFAKAIAAAMNTAGIKQIDGELFGAVMIVVAERGLPPLGGGINFNESNGQWEADEHVQQGTPKGPTFIGEVGIA